MWRAISGRPWWGVLLRVEKKIADVTHTHYTHGEPFNVLR